LGNGDLRAILDVSGTLSTNRGRQYFFHKPAIVPAVFNGVNYTYALALGAGDRAELGDETADVINHFYVFLDDLGEDGTVYTEADLVERAYTDLTNSYTPEPQATVCDSSAFTGENKGWYLSLRPDEKVNYQATVIASHVFFTTFEPGDGLTATNPPDICGGGEPIGDDDDDDDDPGDGPICRASGLGRIYDVGLNCGLGDYSEVNDIVTGYSSYTIGNTTHVQFTFSGGAGRSGPPPGVEATFVNDIMSSTTNWRQE
jgi:hypothetical protein